MKINITVLIQIVHFWIAYTMLSRYLLKPFLFETLKKERMRSSLKDHLQQQEMHLQHLLADKDLQLVDFRKTMRNTYLTIEKEREWVVVQGQESIPQAKNISQASVVELLAKKVLDAYRN